MSSYPTSELPPNERPRTANAGWAEREPLGTRGFEHDGYNASCFHTGSRTGLGRFFWPAMLIFAGLIFFMQNLGVLPGAPGASAWDWMMVAAGAVLLGGQVIAGLMGEGSESSLFWMIGGAILMMFGLSKALAVDINFGNWWPVILIAIGLSALFKGFRR